ncbi:hypothetical protein NDA11_000688 [Ustilago hordei]|nr:hypothetical protein NDA15_001761 [Ustilago hordei]KAJ1590176.1 hypothetical protein NDA12_004813 [Ustilago hordei]KAJ1594168.1 hypothetical protein NDA11_000688 [Ustilago hordei]
MWFIRTALILTTAASSAVALWPQPKSLTTSKSITRISTDLSFNLVQSTDRSRVPSDLTEAIDAAAKLANSVDLWPLTPDRGEGLRGGVGESATDR